MSRNTTVSALISVLCVGNERHIYERLRSTAWYVQGAPSKAAVKHRPHTFRIKKEPMELLDFTTVTGSPIADWNDLISESEDENDNVNGAMGRDGSKDGSNEYYEDF